MSHKQRVALIEDRQAMKIDLDRLVTRLEISQRMLQEDYWTVGDKIFLDLFKERLKR